MCVNNDSATAGIEPATSSRKSNALTTAPQRHTVSEIRTSSNTICIITQPSLGTVRLFMLQLKNIKYTVMCT